MSRPFLATAFAFLSLLAFALNAEPAPSSVHRADVVFQEDFNRPEALSAWKLSGPGKASIDISVGAGGALRVEAATSAGGSASIRLPLEKLRGTRLSLEARVKADHVTAPRDPWNGVKVMLHTESPTAGPQWANPNGIDGTFDWKPVGLTVTVPRDATEATLTLGLQDSAGVVWFDDVKLTITGIARARPAQPAVREGQPFTPWRGTDLPRLRGVMYGPRGNEDDLCTLAVWNANMVRWQLHWVVGGKHDGWQDMAAYNAWLEDAMKELDAWLPLCEKLGIKVLVDLHTPPGGGISLPTHDWPLFQEKRYQDRFLAVWDKLATHYRNSKAVWGYDLANEPIEGVIPPGLLDWHDLAAAAAKRVRAIDPTHAIIIEFGPSGSWGNIDFFEPIDVSGIVYSIHFYEPGQFTHQGVHKGSPTGVAYPGKIGGREWNKETIRRILEPVRQYQLDYGVQIYVGEFSAIRWAPGDSACQYLRDAIDTFEGYGWDWTYHAFREWQGWSVEYDSDRKSKTPSATETDRAKLLKGWFAKDRRDAK